MGVRKPGSGGLVPGEGEALLRVIHPQHGRAMGADAPQQVNQATEGFKGRQRAVGARWPGR
jgi:hypothetical protein